MSIKKIFYIIIISVFANKATTQTNPVAQVATKEEVVASYKKVWDWFVKTPNYSFDLKYTSYKSHTSNEIVESSNGYYKRFGSKYKTEAVGMKTIQNEKVKIIVDTTDKIIALTNPGTLSPNIQNTEDLVKLLENVKALMKKSFNKSTLYRIDFRKNELYEAYEFVVNEKGFLEKLIYYYSEQIEKDYGNGGDELPMEFKVKPRLEVVFFNYIIPAKITETEFTDKSIVLADNRKVTLLEKYKTFQIKDYRFKGKK